MSLINTIIGAGVAIGGAAKGMSDSAKYANQADKQTEEQRARTLPVLSSAVRSTLTTRMSSSLSGT